MVRDLLNLHQRTDKGLGGPAAGPAAWAIAERVFAAAGYQVESAPSDWLIEPPEQAFQRMLITGWAHAATEIAPLQADTIADWLRRRLGHVAAGRSRIIVHHVDMAATLGGSVAGNSVPGRWGRKVARFDAADIRRYYDRHSAAFVRFGQGRAAIHRAVWGHGTRTREDAFHYVDDQIVALVRPFVSPSRTVHVVDLGCGVGASLRYLAERLPIREPGSR